MCKTDDKSSDKHQAVNIEDAFKNKQTNEFYRYYYWKQSDLISCWDQLLHCYHKDLLEHGSSKWLFRGDIAVCDQKRSMSEAFKTSLDKAFQEFETQPQDCSRIEKAIVRAFRRRAHLLTTRDATQTHLETFALLRHYGGPARILDWMYSFFPAVYFAINRYDKNEVYSMWALNRGWLNHMSEHLEAVFLRDQEYLKDHFDNKRTKLRYLRRYENNRFQSYIVTYLINKGCGSSIYAANPYRFNERLVAQRGVLFFSGAVEKTWGRNLQDTMTESLNSWPHKKKGREIKGPILWEIPLQLSKAQRNEFLKRLDEMNINQATLFPDLGGFAESLRTRIAHPESLGIDG